MRTLQLEKSKIYFQEIPRLSFAGSVLVVSEDNVAPLYLESILSRIQCQGLFSLTLPSGEGSKSFESLQRILHFALECGLDRQSTMVALGGGVISDLVGLASGIFMRGIDFCAIPTTLLAQVDASVGGKCGINTAYGKNLIGLFHQARSIYICPHFLQTLPPREFNAGMAEIIKMAICFSSSLFERLFDLEWLQGNLLELIYEAVSIKASVVSQDYRESGLRMALNYGHTFGHAIELENGFEDILHGEAVGLGMVMENTLAHSLNGFANEKEVIALLKLHKLPTEYRIKNLEAFYRSLFSDKKAQKGQIRFILPKQIESFELYSPSEEEILKTLREFSP